MPDVVPCAKLEANVLIKQVKNLFGNLKNAPLIVIKGLRGLAVIKNFIHKFAKSKSIFSRSTGQELLSG